MPPIFETGRERIAGVLFYGVVFTLAYLVFLVFEPFLVPLGWATVFVVVFHPLQNWLERRMRPGAAAGLSTAVVTVILIVPALLLSAAVVREGIEAMQSIQSALSEGRLPWVQRGWDWLQQHLPEGQPADMAALTRDYGQRLAGFLAARATAVVRNVLGFLFNLFVMLFAMFFLFRDRAVLLQGIERLLPFGPEQTRQILLQTRELIQASVTSSLIVGVVQGLLGGITFALLDITGALFWGVVMVFCALIPLLGTGIVIVPAVIWLLVEGQWAKAAVLAVVGAGVIGLADNFLRPMLISGRARLSGLVIFVSVLGGVAAFGMLGIVLGPIVVAAAASLLDAYTTEPELVSSADS
jgi:predicted PurR-regulated permease PerM